MESLSSKELEFPSKENMHIGGKDLVDTNNSNPDASLIDYPNAKKSHLEVTSKPFTVNDQNGLRNILEVKEKILAESQIISRAKIFNEPSFEETASTKTTATELATTDLIKISISPSVAFGLTEEKDALLKETSLTRKPRCSASRNPELTKERLHAQVANLELTKEPLPVDSGNPKLNKESLHSLSENPDLTNKPLSELYGDPNVMKEAMSAPSCEFEPREVLSTLEDRLFEEQCKRKKELLTLYHKIKERQKCLFKETKPPKVFSKTVSKEKCPSVSNFSRCTHRKLVTLSPICDMTPNNGYPLDNTEISSKKNLGAENCISGNKELLDSSRIENTEVDILAHPQGIETKNTFNKHLSIVEQEQNSTQRKLESDLPVIHDQNKLSQTLPTFAKQTESISKGESSTILKPMNPTNDPLLNKDVNLKNSLLHLLSLLSRWVGKCLAKTSSSPEKITIEDLKDFTMKELDYGLEVLKKMSGRVDALLEAAEGLPDPAFFQACRLGDKRSSNHDRLKDAGMKVKLSLMTLKKEAIEDYDRLLLVCNDNTKLNYFHVKELKEAVFKIMAKMFANASENIYTISLHIENFRKSIFEFRSEIIMLL